MIVQAAMAEAAATGTPVAELSLDRIARRAGMSRSTVYRRMRTRRALDDAVRDHRSADVTQILDRIILR